MVGAASLMKDEKNMNATMWRDILGEHMFHSAQDLRLEPRFNSQQDSNPKHTVKTTKASGQPCECPWVIRSPDLNPLENHFRCSPSNLIKLDNCCKEQNRPRMYVPSLWQHIQKDSRLYMLPKAHQQRFQHRLWILTLWICDLLMFHF